MSPCGCGKKRTERLAAKKAVTASAKQDPNEPRAFQPARWGKPTPTPKEA